MAMILLEPDPVQKWLDEQHGGDRLIAFTRVMTPSNVEVSDLGGGGNVGSVEATRQALELDPDQRSWLLRGRAGLLTVTATHFYVLQLGGLKEKIKATIFDAPRPQMHFTANDVTIGKITWRHWLVTGFPDGRYLLEPQVLGKSGKPSKIAPGSETFLAELGDRVRHLGDGQRAT